MVLSAGAAGILGLGFPTNRCSTSLLFTFSLFQSDHPSLTCFIYLLSDRFRTNVMPRVSSALWRTLFSDQLQLQLQPQSQSQSQAQSKSPAKSHLHFERRARLSQQRTEARHRAFPDFLALSSSNFIDDASPHGRKTLKDTQFAPNASLSSLSLSSLPPSKSKSKSSAHAPSPVLDILSSFSSFGPLLTRLALHSQSFIAQCSRSKDDSNDHTIHHRESARRTGQKQAESPTPQLAAPQFSITLQREMFASAGENDADGHGGLLTLGALPPCPAPSPPLAGPHHSAHPLVSSTPLSDLIFPAQQLSNSDLAWAPVRLYTPAQHGLSVEAAPHETYPIAWEVYLDREGVYFDGVQVAGGGDGNRGAGGFGLSALVDTVRPTHMNILRG